MLYLKATTGHYWAPDSFCKLRSRLFRPPESLNRALICLKSKMTFSAAASSQAVGKMVPRIISTFNTFNWAAMCSRKCFSSPLWKLHFGHPSVFQGCVLICEAFSGKANCLAVIWTAYCNRVNWISNLFTLCPQLLTSSNAESLWKSASTQAESYHLLHSNHSLSYMKLQTLAALDAFLLTLRGIMNS